MQKIRFSVIDQRPRQMYALVADFLGVCQHCQASIVIHRCRVDVDLEGEPRPLADQLRKLADEVERVMSDDHA